MYLNFYGLKEKPFQLLPDPSYFFLSSKHKTALNYLEYGILNNVGFIVITGEIGSGKTTLIKKFLSQLEKKIITAVIS
ncbi:MAG TPA: general secretion pathway protein GspA, partial [Candidatus Desulfofervidus auxilii]|nr:general secretion pathway protein GspA [Candidatus Desulfofervidus auxilii]